MKIEKLNENKIRITLNIEDLKQKDINFQEFMSNSIDSQEAFFDMLDQAEKEVGFSTENCKIHLEAIATPNNTFILTVTKENYKQKKSKNKSTYKNTHKHDCAIFIFKNINDFFDYKNSISKNLLLQINENIKNTSLYLLNDNFYLIADKIKNNNDFINTFCPKTLEFAEFVSDSKIYKNSIIEHGKILIKNKALLK